ncbi:MAG: GtrA family protein [Promethearchaeota archaeon]
MEVEKQNYNDSLKRQMSLYFSFALCMIFLNYLIQKVNQLYFSIIICQNFGHIELIQIYYCSTEPYNMPELMGSIAAVCITYITKFFLDKYIVFKKTKTTVKETSEEFMKYFGFAILTTIINIGIQFLMTNFIRTPLEISMLVALSIGYSVKFLLDRKYVFSVNNS